jgi:hypothetical protein
MKLLIKWYEENENMAQVTNLRQMGPDEKVKKNLYNFFTLP